MLKWIGGVTTTLNGARGMTESIAKPVCEYATASGYASYREITRQELYQLLHMSNDGFVVIDGKMYRIKETPNDGIRRSP